MDLNSHISKSFDHRGSTIFEATLEQAQISMKNFRPKQVPLNLSREPTFLRSSRTFASTVFKPPIIPILRVNVYKPMDHSSSDLFGATFERPNSKSLSSKALPNFTPTYSYQPNWPIENPKFLSKTPEKPIKSKESPHKSNEAWIKLIERKPKRVNFCSESQNLPNSRFLKTPPPRSHENKIESSEDFTPTLPKKKSTLNQDLSRCLTPQPIKKQEASPLPPTNYCLSITSAVKNPSEFVLREICKGYPVLSVSTQSHITDSSRNSAEIMIKSNSSQISQLKNDLAKNGFEATEKIKSNGKKNNYNDLANHSFLNSFICEKSPTPIKRHHLKSNEDLFGSSSFVPNKSYGRRMPDKQSLVLDTWNRMKVPQKSVVVNSLYKTSSNYMKSTISFNKKCRLTN